MMEINDVRIIKEIKFKDNNKQRYVLGFIFNEELDKVLLIEKTKGPCNMTGRLNGIGGKIEENEEPKNAMSRECFEETGINIFPNEWVNFADLDAEFGFVNCFYCVSNRIFDYEQKEEEKLDIYYLFPFDNVWVGQVDTLEVKEKYFKNYLRMNNIDWLISMALNNFLKLDSTGKFEIKEIYG